VSDKSTSTRAAETSLLDRLPSSSPLRSRIAEDLAVAVPALVVYGLTLAPTITTGDSGELVTAAATLSLAHPTGYPLYLLLGHAFIALFGFLSPAVAMNLFSAVAAAATCVVVRRLIAQLTGDRAAAIGTALLFAFTQSFWSQATAARVYALGALLLALALLELARLYERNRGSLGRASFWFGLGMANHTVTLVLAPLLVIASFRYAQSWPQRIRAAAWSLPGLSLYAYIPIAASHDPVQNWGDPSNWERLIAYLSRESFWSKRYVDEADDLWTVAAHYLDAIPAELSWPGAALLIFGVGICATRRRGVLAVGLYLFAANMALMALHGSRQDLLYWNRYMITGWLGLTGIAGFGFARVLAAIPRPNLRAGVVVLVPALAVGVGYSRADRSSDTWAHDFAARILDSVEPGALLFVEEDNVVFPLSYLHYVEGRRADVELVMQGINRLDQMNIDPVGTPTYFSHPRELGMPALELAADGLVFRMMPAGSGFTGRPWEGLPSFDITEEPSALRYLDRSLIGNYYFLKAINLEPHDREAALRAVRTLRRVSFDNAVNQVNAGLLLERNLVFREAFEAFDSAAQIDPSNDLAVQRARLWRAALASIGGVRDPAQRAERLAAVLLDAGQSDLALQVLRGVGSAD
jgi:hypothetical protein